jgi:integrating conjugative element protein (TIGR03758 family)
MSLAAAQTTAFQAAVGYSPSSTSGIVASFVVVAFFLWASWVVLFRMQQWRQGTGDLNDLAWSVVRAAGLLLLVFWFIN